MNIRKILLLGVLPVILGIVLSFAYLAEGTSVLVPEPSPIQPPTDYSSTFPVTHESPAILALKEGNLFSMKAGYVANKQLTSGGGFTGTNQYSYWYSPDQTKILTRQNKKLLLITKDGNKPITAPEFKGSDFDVAWRSDGKAFTLFQGVAYPEFGIGTASLSEIVTYDLTTNKAQKIKEVADYGNVRMWDADLNIIGYTVGGGEGGAFGEYHLLNLNTNKDMAFKSKWHNPVTTPDSKEFILLQESNTIGKSDELIIYSALNPSAPLRTFAAPEKFSGCALQPTSTRCLGDGKKFWFVDALTLKSFDTQSGIIANVASLPATATVLDVSKDKKVLLLKQTAGNKSEYKTYDLTTNQLTDLGSSYEALGFIY